MEPVTGIVTVLGVLGNVVLGFLTLWQRAKKRTAEQQLDTVEEGLLIVEAAVEESSPGPNAVKHAITKYGPVARRAVDEARRILHQHKP